MLNHQQLLSNSVVSDNKAFVDWIYIISFATQHGISSIKWNDIKQMVADGKIPAEQ